MTAECWSCGVELNPPRPHRAHYDSEPAWLIACGVWLDFTYPRRAQQRERIREWDRLALEADPVALRSRIVELIFSDDLTTDDDAELARLITLWKTHDTARPNRKAARS